MSKLIKVEELVLIPQVTFRTGGADPAVVAEYAGLMERGVTFPPLTVAEVGKAAQRVLVGGAHRLAAALKAKLAELPVNVVACKSAADAELLAFTDNASHGLPLTAEDRRKAIIKLLQSPSLAKLSNATLAKRLGVSDMSIKRYRDAIGEKSPQASKSGHKNRKPGKVSTEPKVDKGGQVVEPPANTPRAAWRVHEGGSWSGGGVEHVTQAITARVTEGVGRKSVTAWNARCDYVSQIAASLQAWSDANRVKE